MIAIISLIFGAAKARSIEALFPGLQIEREFCDFTMWHDERII